MANCFVCGCELQVVVKHHRCYDPEILIDVCKHCHKEIHHNINYLYLNPVEFYKALIEGRIGIDKQSGHIILKYAKMPFTAEDCQPMIDALKTHPEPSITHWNKCAFPVKAK